MGENLFVGSHKGSNKAYRDGWERTFGEKRSKEPMVTNYCLEEDHGQMYAHGLHICPKCGFSTMPIFHPHPEEIDA